MTQINGAAVVPRWPVIGGEQEQKGQPWSSGNFFWTLTFSPLITSLPLSPDPPTTLAVFTLIRFLSMSWVILAYPFMTFCGLFPALWDYQLLFAGSG